MVGCKKLLMIYFLNLVFLVLTATYAQSEQGSYLHDSSHIQDEAHIREHMKGYMDDVDQLKLGDRESREFHYFKLHDYDNNNKLDGLELGAAMTHVHGHSEGGQENEKGIDISDEELARLVEGILKDDDLNADGYIDYYEFMQAQHRNAGANEET